MVDTGFRGVSFSYIAFKWTIRLRFEKVDSDELSACATVHRAKTNMNILDILFIKTHFLLLQVYRAAAGLQMQLSISFAYCTF